MLTIEQAKKAMADRAVVYLNDQKNHMRYGSMSKWGEILSLSDDETGAYMRVWPGGYISCYTLDLVSLTETRCKCPHCESRKTLNLDEMDMIPQLDAEAEQWNR